MDERKLEAFAAYCHLSQDKPHPLSLLRQLVPLIKEEALATHLHWTDKPTTLTIHLEFKASAKVEPLLLALRSPFQEYILAWQPEEGDPLKGTLTMEKKVSHK